MNTNNVSVKVFYQTVISSLYKQDICVDSSFDLLYILPVIHKVHFRELHNINELDLHFMSFQQKKGTFESLLQI